MLLPSTPDYRPALSLQLVIFTSNFSRHLSTFIYSHQESCNLGNSSSGCSVEFTIHNLMRCVSYQSTATILIGNQRENPVVVESTVMQSEGLQPRVDGLAG